MSWYPLALPSQAGRRFLVTGANAGLGFFTAATARRRGRARRAQRAQPRAAGCRGGGDPRCPARGVRRDARDGPVVARRGRRAAPSRCSPTRRSTASSPTRAWCIRPPHAWSRSTATSSCSPRTCSGTSRCSSGCCRTSPHGARIVSLGSLSTRLSTFRIDDLAARARLRPLAGLRAVQDRDAGGRIRARPAAASRGLASSRASSRTPATRSAAARPTVPGVNEPSRGERFVDALQSAWAQGKHRGAEIPLYALTAPEVEGGQFWGPEYLTRGRPTLQRPTRVSTDPAVAARVWAFAEQATGRPFRVGG